MRVHVVTEKSLIRLIQSCRKHRGDRGFPLHRTLALRASSHPRLKLYLQNSRTPSDFARWLLFIRRLPQAVNSDCWN